MGVGTVTAGEMPDAGYLKPDGFTGVYKLNNYFPRLTFRDVAAPRAISMAMSGPAAENVNQRLLFLSTAFQQTHFGRAMRCTQDNDNYLQ
jgi:hypothetical protein